MQEKAGGKDIFPLVNSSVIPTVFIDKADPEVISKTAGMFSEDVFGVSGKKIHVSCDAPVGKYAIIYGTITGNSTIKSLVENHKLDVSAIEGKWESYIIQIVNNPCKNVSKALVIAGSDRRGAAYGLFTVSEVIGVSPWVWWADVPVEKHSSIYLSVPKTISKEPSVKYRGIFINDEDWGMTPWASKTYEPEVGNIGPKTYTRVCELLLRLKANYLAPAMHPVSTAFNAIAENKVVADSYAIVMGSTHCEPLLFNTAAEWNKKTMGAWDYKTNKDKILSLLEKRVQENCAYENVYTLALRGLHDEAMGIGVPMKDKVAMLQSALMDQRNILAKNIKTPISEVPQAFTPYKEVLEIYLHGLEIPEDITIVWPDDNYGYLKQLSNPKEQARSGGSGTYYHVSYLGVPQSYLWFSTTPTALMYEELSKVYRTGGDRVWLCNCGDIKGCEPQVSFFLDLAYHFEDFSQSTAHLYYAQWLTSLFGQRYYDEFEKITLKHIDLAFSHKPDYMGWGFWNNHWGGGGEKRTDTEYSFTSYGEAQKRIADYRILGEEMNRLYSRIEPEKRDALFQLLYYPVKGAEYMNLMNLGGQQYRNYVIQGRSASEGVKKEVFAMHDSLELITRQYNELKEGKWRYMMALVQNYKGDSHYFEVPIMKDSYQPTAIPSFGILVDGEQVKFSGKAYHELPVLNSLLKNSSWVEVYNKSSQALKWNATSNASWITLSQHSGEGDAKVEVNVDWTKAPADPFLTAEILFTAGEATERVLVSAFRPDITEADAEGLYLEHNGYVSIPATGISRKFENADIKIDTVPGLGFEGSSLRIGDPLAPLQMYRDMNDARVEYDFYTTNSGMVDVYTYVLPTYPLHSARDFKLPEHTNSDTKYSVCIDGGNIATPSTSATEYSQIWYDSILKNCRINKSTLYVDKPGKHTIAIRCGDPGTIIQKIVIDMGGLKSSLMGPESTQYSSEK